DVDGEEGRLQDVVVQARGDLRRDQLRVSSQTRPSMQVFGEFTKALGDLDVVDLSVDEVLDGARHPTEPMQTMTRLTELSDLQGGRVADDLGDEIVG
ncbi:hypothetical protein BVRB_042100, partial [Beta vulgaris subsp. vulgaris]